jgi:hypothetical protein
LPLLYLLVPDSLVIRDLPGQPDVPQMPQAPLIEFQWFRDRDGYDLLPELEKPEKPETLLSGGPTWWPLRVARRGGSLEPYRPLDRFDALYIQLTRARKPADVLDFVQRFGPLTKDGLGEPGGFCGYDDVELVLRHASAMRALIRDAEEHVKQRQGGPGPSLPTSMLEEKTGGNLTLGTLTYHLIIDPETRMPRLAFSPDSLLSALWLQFGTAVSGGGLRYCQHCGTPFKTGPGGRRAGSSYCSDAHQQAAKIARRSHKEKETPNA